MKNSIIMDLKQRLIHFQNTEQNPQLKELAGELINKISQARTSHELKNCLNSYCSLDSSEKETIRFFGHKSNIFERINYIEKTIELKENCNKILKNLLSIQSIEEVILFLKEIVDDPRTLLHVNTYSFFKMVEDPLFPDALRYIAKLEQAPFPEKTPTGSFAAIKAVNQRHAYCIQLLVNNSAAYNESEPCCILVNNLLQNALRIFLDLQEEEETIEHKEENKILETKNSNEKNKGFCYIL